MNSEIFLEKQYYLCYLSFLISGVFSYKSEHPVINGLLKMYSYLASFSIVALVPMDIISFIIADPEHVSYVQLCIGFLFHFPTAFKVIFFKFVKAKYEILMCYLEHETLVTKNEEILKIFQKEKEACRIFNKIYLLMLLISAFCFTVPPIVVGLYNIFGNESDTLITIELPFPISLPYNMNTTTGYCIGAFHMFIQIQIATLALIGTDVLISGLMRTLIGHLKCLGKWFSLIQSKKDIISQSRKTQEDEFKKAIQYLQRIYIGHQGIENIQHFMLFTQYLCSIAILALGLYNNTKDFKVDVILLKSCGFFVIVLFQPFLYCYFGDMVNREAENVKTALYDCDWIGSTISYQRLLVLTMTRLNKPMIFTCGKLVQLNNSAFLTIVNTSYSAFNLLKRSNEG